MIMSLLQGMEAIETETEAHEKKRRRGEISDCDQQRLSLLDYNDLLCFYNRERTFWQFRVRLAVVCSLQRTRPILDSMTARFGSAIQSNNFEPGSDL